MDPMTPLAQPRRGRGRPPVRLEEIALEWLGDRAHQGPDGRSEEQTFRRSWVRQCICCKFAVNLLKPRDQLLYWINLHHISIIMPKYHKAQQQTDIQAQPWPEGTSAFAAFGLRRITSISGGQMYRLYRNSYSFRTVWLMT